MTTTTTTNLSYRAAAAAAAASPNSSSRFYSRCRSPPMIAQLQRITLLFVTLLGLAAVRVANGDPLPRVGVGIETTNLDLNKPGHQTIFDAAAAAVDGDTAATSSSATPPQQRRGGGGRRALRGQKSDPSKREEDREDAATAGGTTTKGERKGNVGSVSRKKGRGAYKGGRGDKPNGGGDNKPLKPLKRQQQNGGYSRYFVEACQQELIADVINGGIIQHKQYVDFIYDYCLRETTASGRASKPLPGGAGGGAGVVTVVNRGSQCNKGQENKGFDGLANDMKLMYIKSFCPQDVHGQVSCLHGMNERGRGQVNEFDDEIEGLCRDLEKLMFKNDLLEESVNKVPHSNGDLFNQPQLGASVKPGSDSVNNNNGQQDTVSGYETISEYVSGAEGGGKNDFTVSFVGQQTNTNNNRPPPQQQQSPPKPPPTPRPTRRPATRRPTTPRPTRAPKHANKSTPPPLAPPPWERPTTTYGGGSNTGILQQDSDSHIPGRSTSPPASTSTTNNKKPLDLIVLDANGNRVFNDTNSNNKDKKKKKNEEGMPAGNIVAIILIVLLGIAIAFSTLLLIRKWRLTYKGQQLHEQQHGGGGRFRRPPTPGIFFINMRRKVKPMDDIDVTVTEGETHKTNDNKTYAETEEGDHHGGDDDRDAGDELEERFHKNSNGDSIGSEEIDFHGPLFDSWPAVAPNSPNSDEHLVDTSSDMLRTPMEGGGDNDQDADSTPGLRTFTSSLLSSFFSRAKRGEGEDGGPSTENAIDEIKRAIDDAQWQEVYYLASKMAAEGNIDSNENLQSALVRSSNDKGGGNFAAAARNSTAARNHLKPEDEQRAAQLDVSLQVGDWITLAARAAVFAALDSANNPVPASISFVNGQKSNVDECLAKAKAALEEAQKAHAKKQEELEQQQQQQQQISVTEDSATQEPEQVVFVDADVANTEEDDFDYSYPKDDYSDFTKSPPRGLEPEPACVVEEVESVSHASGDSDEDDDDEGSESSSTRESIPGPPSIAMSNQSTLPTIFSAAGSPVQKFATIEETARGPFQRDFEHGTSHRIMTQDDDELEGKPGQSL